MLLVQNQLLPEDRAKLVKEWLQQPAAQIFVAWLSNQCAGLAAEAGNKMVENQEGDEADARNLAERARQYLGAFEIMSKVLPNDFQFEVATFREKPLTTQ